MTTAKRMLNPRTQRQAEQLVSFGTDQFGGMSVDVASTEVPDNIAYRNINVIDKGGWFEGRPGSAKFMNGTADIDYTEDPLWARTYVNAMNMIVSVVGNRIVLRTNEFDKPTDFDQDCLIIGGETNGAEATIAPFQKTAVIFAGNTYLVRKLCATKYAAIRMNSAIPPCTSGDFSNNGLVKTSGINNCYRYTYSYSRLDGGPRKYNRYKGAEIVIETGTMQREVSVVPDGSTSGSSVGYTDYWVQFPIDGSRSKFTCDRTNGPGSTISTFSGGVPLGSVGTPDDSKEITHYSMYRTKNIGVNSANNPAQYVWLDDVPVVKMVPCQTNMTLTEEEFHSIVATLGEIGYFFDDGGTSWNEGFLFSARRMTNGLCEFVYKERTSKYAAWTIVDFDIHDGKHQSIVYGSTRYGHGQVDFNEKNKFTVLAPLGIITTDDIGQTLWSRSGCWSTIVSVVGNVVTLSSPLTDLHKGLYFAVGCDGSRAYFDTTADDGKAFGEFGLTERMLTQDTMYLPNYGYKPLPPLNTGVATMGMIVASMRDDTKLYYSATGDKPFALGQYRDDIQFEDTNGNIQHIMNDGGNIGIFHKDKSFLLPINSNAYNAGNELLGEYIPKLQQSIESDTHIGVSQWRTMCQVMPGKWLAVTNEPAVRVWDSQRWQKTNYGALNGLANIMTYLRQVGPETLQAYYSDMDGYLIWGYRWEDSEDIIDIDIPDNTTMMRWIDVGGLNNPIAVPLVDGSAAVRNENYTDIGGEATT